MTDIVIDGSTGEVISYEDTFTQIIDRVTAGTPVRRAIGEVDNGNTYAFYRYCDQSPEAAQRYARARAAMLDALADDIVQLADTPLIGTKTKETKDGDFTETGDNVERTRLMIDSRKWLLAKLAPKKYGEHLAIEHSGNIGNAMVERLAAARKLLTQTPQPANDEEAA